MQVGENGEAFECLTIPFMCMVRTLNVRFFPLNYSSAQFRIVNYRHNVLSDLSNSIMPHNWNFILLNLWSSATTMLLCFYFGFFIFYTEVRSYSICLPLPDLFHLAFTLKVHTCCQKCQDCFPFYGGIISHSVYILHSLSLFILCWILRLFLCLGYHE